MSSAEDRIRVALEYLTYRDGRACAGLNDIGVRILRAILQPPPRRHTFGGVTFEETGEVRLPRLGEWYAAKFRTRASLCCVARSRHDFGSGAHRTILRYVPESGVGRE